MDCQVRRRRSFDVTTAGLASGRATAPSAGGPIRPRIRMEVDAVLTIPALLIILAFVFAVLALAGRFGHALAIAVFLLALERLYTVVMIGMIR
jgi:hypothetical protein